MNWLCWLHLHDWAIEPLSFDEEKRYYEKHGKLPERVGVCLRCKQRRLLIAVV